MIINGKKIAEEKKDFLREKVSAFSETPKLAVLVARDHPATRSFVRIKETFGEAVGVDVEVHEFFSDDQDNEDSNEAAVSQKLHELNADQRVAGIVVQLPLPAHFDTRAILDAVAPGKDIDVLGKQAYQDFRNGLTQNTESFFLPPVAGAIAEIFETQGVSVVGKKALVIGKGALVGIPVSEYLASCGAEVSVVEKGDDLKASVANADIIVSGAGAPGIIQPDMVKEGCVLIDAGTSEVSGELRGDADPECASRCAVFTPVPGGVGPVTVSCLFENLVKTRENQVF